MNPELAIPPFLLVILFIWSQVIKAVALWRAAKLGQRNWFIAILVINTIGILELIYLFKFSTKKFTLKEIKSWVGQKR